MSEEAPTTNSATDPAAARSAQQHQTAGRYTFSTQGTDNASLRESLSHPARVMEVPATTVSDTSPSNGHADPTADELLRSSPNAVRLCERFDNNRQILVRRGRVQRLGIAALVSAIGVVLELLGTRGELAPSVVILTMLAAAAVSTIALGVMAILWIRDERRLSAQQGQRLARALSLNCSLPEATIAALLARRDPGEIFFEIYAAWATTRVKP